MEISESKTLYLLLYHTSMIFVILYNSTNKYLQSNESVLETTKMVNNGTVV